MIHPAAASDPFLAPLHRSFMISSFVSGGAALFVLPLHLALAGPPHAAVLLVLAWMLGQWPLALYLSRSGALNRAITLSSTLFACFIAAMCVLTGGMSSFALIWLLMPLMETAFATDRKVPFAVGALCGALLAAIAFLPMPDYQIVVPATGMALYATLGALLYAGVLSLRLTLDRMLAQKVVQRTQCDRELIAQGTRDVVCEVAADGTLRLLGGSVSTLVGPLPLADGEDWLFPRLHVADRPLYLTRLSEARHSGKAQRLDVRFRVGATRPGEIGLADYRCLSLVLQLPLQSAVQTDAHQVLLLTLSDARQSALTSEPADVPSGRSSADSEDAAEMMDGAAPAAMSRLSAPAPTPIEQDEAEKVLESAPNEPLHAACELSASLEQCRDLLTPVAARRGIHLDFSVDDNLPLVTVDPKGVRQALNCLLADMIETCGDGAVLLISAEMTDTDVSCVVAVSGRRSAQTWRVAHSKSVIDRAKELLDRAGARLCVPEEAEKDNQVILFLPRSAASDGGVILARTA
ncbi:hypothetical protein [Labrenzia sp. VG12]|uniref:hypothetical protein n=1 Tax=Labrenzia sp. VG12 TaxID=2021862 RepID=UPI000B8BCB67|nr:hypothetical protein [Labrenzia sp. VG12]ASP33302.1 hypothetical protein CHH27_08620 [Labrenzia sp. VG12]